MCGIFTYIYMQPNVGKYTSPMGILHGKQSNLYEPFETKKPQRWTRVPSMAP